MIAGGLLTMSIIVGAQAIMDPDMIVQENISAFPDIPVNAYFLLDANYMQNLGVINGYENGNFGPNDAVTRAQIVTILKRYDDTLSLLVDDYCSQHQLKIGMMATKQYTALCINRGEKVYQLQ